ncbi:MAG: TonB-dependent receptor [Bacteroidetes bacterium]|nr:TonB-dependent receptor [Bacteroidota bacterium]
MDKFRTPTTKEKALALNLDDSIYGAFSEIGAGQEVAANFFKSGAASGTVASSTSAYDMKISDSLYGETKRYVSEERLKVMLNTEYNHVVAKLPHRVANTRFFAFADTIETINYHRTNQGHGWIGLKFQLMPGGSVNEVILHVKMHDTVALMQQRAIGRIGVNLVYGCYHYFQNPEKLVNSLLDSIGRERIEIDMLRFNGADFEYIDNRLMALMLVRNGLTEATVFEPNGEVHQPSDTLYKKNVLVLRGRFRPVTHVNLDMFKKGLEQFKRDEDVDPDRIECLFELTLKDLKSDGAINPKDFLDRVDTLGALGHRVLISNYVKHYKLVQYLSKLTKGRKVGVIMGLDNLKIIFDEGYYTNLSGGILEAFGLGFGNNIKLLVYPFLGRESGRMLQSHDLTIPDNLKGLYSYLIDNKKLEDIEDADRSIMHIFSDDVIRMLKNGEDGWEAMVPDVVANKIKEQGLFVTKPKSLSV